MNYWEAEGGCAVCFLFNIMSFGLVGCNTHYAAAAGNVYQQPLQFVTST